MKAKKNIHPKKEEEKLFCGWKWMHEDSDFCKEEDAKKQQILNVEKKRTFFSSYPQKWLQIKFYCESNWMPKESWNIKWKI